MSASLLDHFAPLEDPRIERNKRHALLDILVLAISAVCSNAKGWEAIEDFGHAKLEWLRQFVPLANGIPSHDCIEYVMARLSPAKFRECFISWTQAVKQAVSGEVVAIDGKTARGSRDRATKGNPLHMVTAWACESRLVLAQEATDEKSNEITAIPKLLALLELKGCIVTLDAMGCQRAIAEQIKEQKGDYVMGLKGNQSDLPKPWMITSPPPNSTPSRLSPMPIPKNSTRIMADWKPAVTGSPTTCPPCRKPTVGQACAVSVWSNANASKVAIPHWNGVSSLPPYRLMPNALPKQSVGIGGLRIPCTGDWMSPSRKMLAVYARVMALP